jgi:hypothetical protein
MARRKAFSSAAISTESSSRSHCSCNPSISATNCTPGRKSPGYQHFGPTRSAVERRCVNAADAVNLGQYAALGIPGHNSLGLLVVQVQPVADDRRPRSGGRAPSCWSRCPARNRRHPCCFPASTPSVISPLTWGRKMSTVQIVTTPRRSEIRSACVPLPDPGGPIINILVIAKALRSDVVAARHSGR